MKAGSLMVGLVLLTAALAAAPGAATPAAPLAGTTWHTTQIQGDALFFMIDEIGLQFHDDGQFAARVRFVDGQQIVKSGTYSVNGDTITVMVKGNPQPKRIQYSISDGMMIARDTAFDVTVRLVPGKMTEEHWF